MIFRATAPRRFYMILVSAFCCAAAAALGCRRDQPILDVELLAKAQPDECFVGVGNPNNVYPWDPQTDTCSNGRLKVNESYLWGMTKADNHIWMGTGANIICLLRRFAAADGPQENGSYVCEFGSSAFSPPLAAASGDWRMPSIYRYDTIGGILDDMTGTLDDAALMLLNGTVGLRSATNHGGLVFLGGPALGAGVNLFVFDAGTGAFLSAAAFPEFDNIRKWLSVDGVLYTAVKMADKTGAVLRWTGDAVNPFQFDVIASLGSEGANLTLHDGRLFVTTWAQIEEVDEPVQSALYMSPVIPPGGLTAAHAEQWRMVWTVDQYEPDPVTRFTYAGGDLVSYQGYVVWATIHVPRLAAIVHVSVYGEPESDEALGEIQTNTHRALHVFRGRLASAANAQAEPNLDVELLYGETTLPVWNPNAGDGGAWQVQPNNMGVEPMCGPSGFGNSANTYGWALAVYQDRLFLGTGDFSYEAQTGGTPPDADDFVPAFWGADLYRFDSLNEPAVPEFTDGAGNFLNLGVRNLIADDALYVGMGNFFNKLADPNDHLPEGGWELLRLTLPNGS
ncbi:MAG: hypothetical protein V3T70_10875 [Phycisphaerae bacterium]